MGKEAEEEEKRKMTGEEENHEQVKDFYLHTQTHPSLTYKDSSLVCRCDGTGTSG